MKKLLSLVLCLTLCLLCVATASAAYTAGTYTGTGKGRNGEITVDVVFSEKAIESVTVTGHAETLGLGYGVSTAPVMLPEDDEMEIVFDVSVLEVYADGGVFTATDLAFPTQPYTKVSVTGAEAEISYVK